MKQKSCCLKKNQSLETVTKNLKLMPQQQYQAVAGKICFQSGHLALFRPALEVFSP